MHHENAGASPGEIIRSTLHFPLLAAVAACALACAQPYPATPRELVTRVSADVNKVFALPDMKQRMLGQGIDYGMHATPEAHAAYVKSESVRWGKVIREAGVRAE